MTASIVVATDGSETGQRAVDHAAALSEKFGQPLCIVHVLMHGRPSKELARMVEVEGLAAPAAKGRTARPVIDPTAMVGLLPKADDAFASDEVIATLGEHVARGARTRAEDAGARDVTTRIRAGDIADEILDVAAEENADTIVVGRRGLGRMREMLLGSVSQKVLHHATCKVVIVP